MTGPVLILVLMEPVINRTAHIIKVLDTTKEGYHNFLAEHVTKQVFFGVLRKSVRPARSCSCLNLCAVSCLPTHKLDIALKTFPGNTTMPPTALISQENLPAENLTAKPLFPTD